MKYKKKIFFGVGVVNTVSNNIAFYVVDKPTDILQFIVPHFLVYPLKTQKRKDFILWNKIAEMVLRKEHLTSQGLDF
jgi:hypothetical protein